MVAFPYRLPTGFAGQVTRVDDMTVEPGMFNASAMPSAFGVAVAEDANGVRALTAADLVVAGLLVRPYPTSGNGTDGLGVSTPSALQPASKLKRGYMIVKLGGSAAAVKGAPYYVRTSNPGTGKVVGDVEAAADLSAGLTATAKVGITGGGSCTPDATTPLLAGYQAGRYTLVFTSATAWTLIDPQGHSLPNGANGTANADEIKFVTAASGAAFIAGDTFYLDVAPPTIAMPADRSYFMGPADAAGLVEIAFRI